MEVVGSEIGQKMRSAIKAKLTELGCYVDDELPDYVMVMVANKRTRAQMEDDLQLFLGDNTELFVNWLHQVLKKLQEVTVAPPPKPVEHEQPKERSASKERKSKEKKLKSKTKKSDLKKAKKKEKEKSKSQKKKEEKKSHKKKKSKHHEMIRPNIPPLLMNIEKESEPSITDVFAGQILKNHGVLMDPTPIEEPKESKPDIKRPIIPIIDPATILSEPLEETNKNKSPPQAPKDDQIKEITEIEAKIQGLKAKLAEQLDSMSDDEDFLNIRTEAEELMNDFAEDVFQEISSQTTAVETPPIPVPPQKSPSLSLSENLDSPETLESPIHEPIKEKEVPTKEIPTKQVPIEAPIEMETLPQIELNLPKRPVRERLGVLEKKIEKEVKPESPERYTPEREPEIRPSKTAKSRLGDPVDHQRKHSTDEGSDKNDSSTKRERITSKVSSVLEARVSRVKCASVVRVRPRPRVAAPSNSLLLRAVADAHKSLLNTPPKIEHAPKVQRALVLPMRRSIEAQKIVIQVPGGETDDCEHDAISLGDPDSEDDKSFKLTGDEKEEYVPVPITKKIHNTDYTPSRRNDGRTTSLKDDSIVIETINIHNPTTDKDKNTQFIVTMDGYHPNAFLAKKLQTEGLLDDEIIDKKPTSPKKPDTIEKPQEVSETSDIQKRLSNTSEESETQVIIKKEPETPKPLEKRKNLDQSVEKRKNIELSGEKRKNIEISGEKRKNIEISGEKRKNIELSIKEDVPVKKRKSSPIVFDVDQKKDKEKERERQRTESASSDNQVVVTTNTGTHKYDSLPPLSIVSASVPVVPPKAAAPMWCRSFPNCRYGSRCAFQHPRCKFAAACTRRNCVYSHLLTQLAPIQPVVASTVVPAANFKSISATLPAMCKFYPACVNPACHFYHPKPCRYGKNCTNKLDCNFYHADVPNKWFPV